MCYFFFSTHKFIFAVDVGKTLYVDQLGNLAPYEAALCLQRLYFPVLGTLGPMSLAYYVW